MPAKITTSGDTPTTALLAASSGTPRSGILEVIVCSEADAEAAAEGGADRLEVISHYEVGGLTPPLDLVRRIARRVPVALRVMLRDGEPFVVKDEREIADLCAAARALAEMEVDGIVIGFLRDSPDGKGIDHQLLKRVLACAPNAKATFHRAFEELNDPLAAVAELKHYPQVDRILTCGGGAPWARKVQRLNEYQRAARPEIELVIGGGTDADVIRRLKPRGIREFHVGRAVREGRRIHGAVLPDRVRALAELVR